MQLIVEGTENLRRIISVTIDASGYILTPDQAVRMIDNSFWGGWRKSEIHWDEIQQKIIVAPYPLNSEELKAKQKQMEDEILMKQTPDIIRDLQARISELEKKEIKIIT